MSRQTVMMSVDAVRTEPRTGTIPVDPHPAVPWWVNDLVAAVLLAVAAFAPFPNDELRATGVVQILLVLSPAVFLPFRRRWPVPILGLTLALYGVTTLMGLHSPAVGLAVAIAMFGVANRSARRRTIVVVCLSVVVVLLLNIPTDWQNIFDPRIVQFVLGMAFAAAAGDATRSRREYIAAITERAERAERTRESEARRRVTEERLRLARDLHDAVAHQIAVISLNAGAASAALEANPERAKTALGTIRQASRTVLEEIGDLLAVLRADGSGDETAPQQGLDQLEPMLARFQASGLEVHTRIEGDPGEVTGAAGLVAYRVVQEALTNALKHGSERRAHLLLEVTGEQVHIVVTNPVGGTAQASTGTGVGLIGLRERVASVRGTVQAGPMFSGWKIDAALPRTGGTPA